MTSDAPRTVLIVEDTPEDRVTYRRYLAQDSQVVYRISEATTCEGALAICREKLPDCILLDYNLPDGNGLDVLARLFAEYGENTTGVVMLTGIGDTELAVDSMKNGAHDFLDKSHTTPAALHRAVANAIEKVALKRDLERQRQWFRITLASIGDAVIATDMLGHVTFMNAEAESLTGWLAADALVKPLDQVFRIVNESTRKPVSSPAARVLSEGAIVGLANHTILIGKSGREIPIDDSAAPIRDANGDLIGVVIVFRDITQRRRAEEERDELLASEEEAREAAESANRLKDEFLAAVSHELRTPLNAILGWSRVAQLSPLDSGTVKQAFEVIVRSARQQNQLINDILDVSRIVTGKLSLNVQPIDLVLVIGTTIESVRPALDAKKIELKTEYAVEANLVRGDSDRLQQVLWNLLTNSIKFTPSGGRIEVRLERKRDQLEITVCDSGEGIDPVFLPFVFDRFRQADGGTTRRHGGLGLGLAITRHLTEIHGGSVSAESAGKGKGATFTVSLPAIDRDEPEAISTHGRAYLQPDADVSEHLLLGIRVLAVDDEPDALDLISLTLSMHGADVVTACSTDEALSRIKESVPDVLISDIGMSSRDGYALIHEIRELTPEQGGHLPAIALTAYARDEDCIRAIGEGYHCHLAKPVEVIELVKSVAALAAKEGKASAHRKGEAIEAAGDH